LSEDTRFLQGFQRIRISGKKHLVITLLGNKVIDYYKIVNIEEEVASDINIGNYVEMVKSVLRRNCT
jgi:hypothetical protein